MKTTISHSSSGNKAMIYILALGIFGILTTEFSVIGILPQLAEKFNVTVAQAGWLLSGFALTIAIFGPFVTLAASGINRKIALSIVLGVFILSNLFSVFASNFTMLMIARIVPAFFHPIFFSVVMATAAQSVSPSEAPKAVSIVFSGVSIGTVLGVPVAVFFSDLFGWQAAFMVGAAVNLLGLISLLLFLPSMPVKEKMSYGSQVGILKNSKTIWSIVITVLIITGMSASYGYMAEYLKEEIHMNGKTISIMMFLFGLAGVAGNLIVGRLLSKNITRTVLGFIFSLIAVQALLSMFTGSFMISGVLIVLWGFIHTAGFLLGQTLITSSASGAQEFASSIFVSAGNLGFAIGPIAGGIALAEIGTSSLPVVSISILSLAALGFIIHKKFYKK